MSWSEQRKNKRWEIMLGRKRAEDVLDEDKFWRNIRLSKPFLISPLWGATCQKHCKPSLDRLNDTGLIGVWQEDGGTTERKDWERREENREVKYVKKGSEADGGVWRLYKVQRAKVGEKQLRSWSSTGSHALTAFLLTWFSMKTTKSSIKVHSLCVFF